MTPTTMASEPVTNDTFSETTITAYFLSSHIIVCFLLMTPWWFDFFETIGAPKTTIYFLSLVIIAITHAHVTRHFTKDVTATAYIPHIVEYFVAWVGVFIVRESYCAAGMMSG
jgi:hypothetical protein